MIRNPDKTSSKTCVYIGKEPDYNKEGDFVAAPVKKGEYNLSTSPNHCRFSVEKLPIMKAILLLVKLKFGRGERGAKY